LPGEPLTDLGPCLRGALLCRDLFFRSLKGLRCHMLGKRTGPLGGSNAQAREKYLGKGLATALLRQTGGTPAGLRVARRNPVVLHRHREDRLGHVL